MHTFPARSARRKLATLGVALLAAVIAILTVMPTAAHAGGRTAMGSHRPLACKIDSAIIGWDAGGCSWYWGRASGPATPGALTFGYDATIYKDFKDFSVYAPMSNPKFFPKSNGGYNCDQGVQGAHCERSTADAPNKGKAGATVAQLRDYAWRGDLIVFEENDSPSACRAASASNGCFSVDYSFTNYDAHATYTFNLATGELNRPEIMWFNGRGDFIGYSRQFLTTADAYTEYTERGAMEVTSFASPARVVTTGDDVTYGVTVTATKTGSAIVDLELTGLTEATEAVIPSDWVRASALDAGVIRYIVPFLSAGDSQSASLHFKASGDIGVVNTVVRGETNVTSEAAVNVVPAAPTCTVPDGGAVVQKGGEATALTGAICTAAPGTTLATLYDPATAGDLSVALQRDSSTVYQLTYKAHTPDYVGSESIPVYAISSANGEHSDPTQVTVKVVGPAVAVADEYSVVTGTTLQADDATGITANDEFGMGRDGWYVQQGAGPAHGSLTVSPSGSLQYTPAAGYVGDDSFRYRLSGPNGANSQPVTVTIHVTAG